MEEQRAEKGVERGAHSDLRKEQGLQLFGKLESLNLRDDCGK